MVTEEIDINTIWNNIENIEDISHVRWDKNTGIIDYKYENEEYFRKLIKLNINLNIEEIGDKISDRLLWECHYKEWTRKHVVNRLKIGYESCLPKK